MKKKWTTEVPFEVEPVVVEMEEMDVFDSEGGSSWTCPICRQIVWYDAGEEEPTCHCGTWHMSIRAELRRA